MRRNRYSADERRRLKRSLTRRYGRVCHWCGCVVFDVIPGQCSPQDLTLDHIVPHSKGGGNTLANLVLACRECNEARGDRPAWWVAA